jgi:hypothetical protein
MSVSVPKVEVKKRGRSSPEKRLTGYRVTVLESDVSEKKYEVKTKSVETRHGSLENALPYESLVDLENAVSLILDNYGIVGNDRIKYLNFARKIWREIAKYGFIKSSTLNGHIAVWRSKGATEKILRDISALFDMYMQKREVGGEGGEVTL